MDYTPTSPDISSASAERAIRNVEDRIAVERQQRAAVREAMRLALSSGILDSRDMVVQVSDNMQLDADLVQDCYNAMTQRGEVAVGASGLIQLRV